MAAVGQYAEVIVNKAVERVDRVFHYQIPERLRQQVGIGSLVMVPFGNQKIEGVVVGLTTQADVETLKEITALVSQCPLFHPDLLQLAAWIADYYLCTKVSVLKAMLPAGLKLAGQNVQAKIVNFVSLTDPAVEIAAESLRKAPAQEKILRFLQSNPPLSVVDLLAATGANRSALTALQSKGLLRLEPREVFRDPQSGEDFLISQPQNLTAEQENAMKEIADEMAAQCRPVLIYGVTGSGKTEIYLRLAQEMIRQGKQSIILVPEIALTPQMVAVFKARLGDQVAVLHSGLSSGEKRDAWLRISAGEIDVVVGARSAVFAPCPQLGLIVIDEEQEQCYKQDNIPRFHAREVALQRARLQGAQVVLGSATPSIETYDQAQGGAFRLVTLKKRIFDRPLPRVRIVDMREELRAGNRSIFSGILRTKITEHLAAQGQILLFLNRRGYHTFVSCRSCGHVLTCPHCEISLTYHANGLKCHYCGFAQALPRQCPACGSTAIRHFGVGTQRVEDEIRLLFPQARVARVDTDTMGRKGAYEQVYGQMRRGEVDILVGTQMVAKGLDFPGVTLVGVISADISLNLPEMRAAERTFQLITQVAGRAGRGSALGEVVLQTYNPQEAAIIAAASQDYSSFFRQEIARRKIAAYPPFGVMIRLVFSGTIRAEVDRVSQFFARLISSELAGQGSVLGPAPAPLEKIKDRFRIQLYLKGQDLSLLRTALQTALQKAAGSGPDRKDVSIAVDVEPLNMM